MQMSSNEPVVLFTPYFAARTSERQAELDECVRRNLACTHISRLVLLIDDGHLPPLTDPKLEIVHIVKRPTYQQWIDLSRQLDQSCLSILANTDIYFDDTLSCIQSALYHPETFMALTRYDKQGENCIPHPNPHWSQDAWALRSSSCMPETLYKALDVPLGIPRCDNRVAYLFAIHGWKIVNPLKYIYSVHLHETQQRNYDKKADRTVIGGVAYVHPGSGVADPATLEIDVWAKGAQAIKKVSLNKSFDAWSKENPFVAEEEVSVKVPSATRHTETNNVPVEQVSKAKVGIPVRAEVVLDFLASGTLIYHHNRRFCIYRRDDQLLCHDSLNPKNSVLRPAGDMGRSPLVEVGLDLLTQWIPPIVDIMPVVIKDRPTNGEDCHFWQYPCATEKQAYANHLAIAPGENIDHERRIIHSYLPLPWATYIDKKHYPPQVAALIRPRLMGLKSLAEANKYTLAVHTVCQQIHWRRFTKHFCELGITDLHLSHCEKSIDPVREGLKFRVHSWPLIAVNIEDHTRSSGLTIGKPISTKRYLASFVGAHMPHYRSDVRMRLLDVAKKDGGDDVLVDLGSEWHFNKIVYQEQVSNKQIPINELEKYKGATKNYNELLSNSIFSLCPEGAGPNTLRVWESLAVGSVPVIIADDWNPPKISGTDTSLFDCCIFVNASDLDKLFTLLRGMKRSKVKGMQSMCISLYQQARRHRAF